VKVALSSTVYKTTKTAASALWGICFDANDLQF
jgi:hypothetical protein